MDLNEAVYGIDSEESSRQNIGSAQMRLQCKAAVGRRECSRIIQVSQIETRVKPALTEPFCFVKNTRLDSSLVGFHDKYSCKCTGA